MVTVYFETEKGSYAEKVAEFETEELYMTCLPALEKQAKEVDMIVTESVFENSSDELLEKIDFKLLREEKLKLLESTEDYTSTIHLYDAIQDHASEHRLKSDGEIFGK